jgi:putative hemolysin
MNELTAIALVIFAVTLIGGGFAAAEIALVSLREGQIKQMRERGDRSSVLLQRLVDDPNRFLATVQVGVTLAGFLSAGYGASRIVPLLAPQLAAWGVPAAEQVAFITVTIVIAYVSLVFAELVPKRLALQRAEGVALALVGPINAVSVVFRPFIWMLSHSTNIVVRMLGADPNVGRGSITGEELRGMLAAHQELSDDERALIDDIFGAGERELREVMVPRTEVAFLDASLPVFKAARMVSEAPHSRYPVVRGSHDDIVGFAHVRDILDPSVVERSIRVGQLVRPVAMFPGTKRVIPALMSMRSTGHHLAIVVDEYGGTAGIVTLEDLMEELIGDIRDEYDVEEVESRQLLGEDMEVDGLLNLEDFEDETGVTLPEGPYETVAGYLVATLGRLPEIGDTVLVNQAQLVVSELDGRRISRVTVLRTLVPD